MTHSVGIVGAGVLGRLLALKGSARGWKVTLFERGGADGAAACSVVPPAMLAPYCELDVAEKAVSDCGANSPDLWAKIIEQFDLDVYFKRNGSIVVAHPHDIDELERFRRGIAVRASQDVFQNLQSDALMQLEPELDRRFQVGLYFPSEGQIDSRSFMKAALVAIQQREIICHFNCDVREIKPYEVHTGTDVSRFDMVIDCRGLGAVKDIKNLRAVRGEIIRVHAPDVHLNRPIRLLHPRWPLYAVPHQNGHYVIGATVIESEDLSPVSVRSMLEMLSTAFTLNAGFSEARILETSVGLRPALPNNEPRLCHQAGLIRINGMYRHGYLLSPVMTDWACALVEGSKAHEHGINTFLEAA